MTTPEENEAIEKATTANWDALSNDPAYLAAASNKALAVAHARAGTGSWGDVRIAQKVLAVASATFGDAHPELGDAIVAAFEAADPDLAAYDATHPEIIAANAARAKAEREG